MNATYFASTPYNSPAAPLAVHGTALNDVDSMPVSPPEWIMLIPAGEFSGRDGCGPFRLTDPCAVIAATSELEMPAGLPIDYDHATDFAAPKGRPAPAAGWIRELAARDGALWGRVEWTSHGAVAIASREYRYISPVFQYTPRGEVTRLLRAGLTNNPNLYLTAISAHAAATATDRSQPDGKADGRGAKGQGAAEDKTMETLLDELRQILNLPADAPAEEAIAAVRALLSDDDGDDDGDGAGFEVDEAATGGEENDEPDDVGRDDGDDHPGAVNLDAARYVTVADFQKVLGELNRLRAQSAHERAAHTVDEAIKAGKLIPAQRQWAIAYCQADVNGFAAFVARQPAVFSTGSACPSALISKPPVRSRASALNRNETAICAQLGLSTEDYLRRKRSGRRDFLRLNHGIE